MVNKTVHIMIVGNNKYVVYFYRGRQHAGYTELSNPNGKCFIGLPQYCLYDYAFKNKKYQRKTNDRIQFTNFLKKIYHGL